VYPGVARMRRDAMNATSAGVARSMNESMSLRDATVQEIQLELLRRTPFNALDGRNVLGSLMRHRDLWLAALLDRPGVANCAEPGLLLMSGLINLRDLSDNLWNADTLFILTATRQAAEHLVEIAEEEEWGGEVYVYRNQSEIDRALEVGREEYGLLSVWWD
jgi:hypothetical protein